MVGLLLTFAHISKHFMSLLQVTEDKKNYDKLQELVEKLSGKLKLQKKQLEEAVGAFIAAPGRPQLHVPLCFRRSKPTVTWPSTAPCRWRWRRPRSAPIQPNSAWFEFDPAQGLSSNRSRAQTYQINSQCL